MISVKSWTKTGGAYYAYIKYVGSSLIFVTTLFIALLCVALQFYRRCDEVDNDMEEMDTEDRQQAVVGPASSENGGTEPVTAAASTTEKKTFSLSQLFSSADLRRPLFIACMLQVIQQFSGINAVSTWHQLISN